ncbi:MAG: hypothetical protein D6698_17360 [Gammaproteobacteria bacterium]|nr:MAG: hypothetical protein D6698_17360 [Gammaproteobacteria bacterium]
MVESIRQFFEDIIESRLVVRVDFVDLVKVERMAECLRTDTSILTYLLFDNGADANGSTLARPDTIPFSITNRWSRRNDSGVSMISPGVTRQIGSSVGIVISAV